MKSRHGSVVFDYTSSHLYGLCAIQSVRWFHVAPSILDVRLLALSIDFCLVALSAFVIRLTDSLIDSLTLLWQGTQGAVTRAVRDIIPYLLLFDWSITDSHARALDT